jgi:hypothetical protein
MGDKRIEKLADELAHIERPVLAWRLAKALIRLATAEAQRDAEERVRVLTELVVRAKWRLTRDYDADLIDEIEGALAPATPATDAGDAQEGRHE